ncbi:MAG: glycosyltransferase family 4 protein [Syntrophales bacterium]|jgi:glycosyltransferase involved in cell wall biosynthesis
MYRILLIHNHLRPPSGENVVFENEKRLLLEKGHNVVTYERRNEEIDSFSIIRKTRLLWENSWSKESCREIERLIVKERPDVVHFHNTFPLISPAAYRVCYKKGIPFVQTLHHFRMICPGALLFRDGHICEDCVSGSLWNGMLHGCYKGSYIQTGLITQMLFLHRAIMTWGMATYYIALNEFCRSIFIRSGIPADKILVKPNFIFDSSDPVYTNDGYVLYLGRVSEEKGIKTLLEAWGFLNKHPLKIAGEGSTLAKMKALGNKLALPNVEFLGYQPPEKCFALIQNSKFMIVPSEGYETFSLVVREAFMAGKPVIASRLGVLSEAVAHGKTGLTFDPGNAKDLAEKVRWMLEHESEAVEMGRNARKEFEEKYTADRNYEILIKIYEKSIQSIRKRHNV